MLRTGDSGPAFRAPVQDDQALRVRNRQCTHHDGIQEAIDRGIGSDAERERQQCRQREPRRFFERSNRKRQVASQIFDEMDPSRVASLFLREADRSEFAPRGHARFGFRHPTGHQLLGQLVDVQLNLALQR